MAAARPKSAQQKHWSVTVNGAEALVHYTENPFEVLFVEAPSDDRPARARPSMSWFVGQLERAPTTGNLHLQLHACFNKKVSQKQVREYFRETNWAGCHVEPCLDLDAHLEYVVKEDSRVLGPFRSPGAPREGGPVKGKRSDLEDAVELVKGGATVEALWRELPMVMVRNHRGLEKLAQQFGRAPERPDLMTVVLYGRPRTGKSTLAGKIAAKFFPEVDPFYKPIGKWFCGYHGQEVIIMDDFDGKGQACREIKNICDKTPCIVETKGGQVNLRNKLVIITSNRDPRSWYGEREESIDASAVLERCLFFRVEERLVVNAGRREGFGLNDLGFALLGLVERAISAEREVGEGESGFRGEDALKKQEVRYGAYGEQIIAVANNVGVPALNLAPPAEAIPEPVFVDDSSSDDEPMALVFESENEEGYEPREAKRQRTE